MEQFRYFVKLFGGYIAAPTRSSLIIVDTNISGSGM